MTLLTVAAFVLIVPTLAGAAPQLLDSRDETLTARDGSTFVVTTGTVRVPELRTATEPGAIDLAFVRIRRGTEPGPHAHVILAGGPGDSAVDVALGMARQGGAALADLIAGDIVGIDQRGTGKSRPHLGVTGAYGLPLDRPGSVDLWLPLVERASREAADAFRAKGIRLEAYNTRESADDVDDVRRALGYEKVTLWGRSYGTHLALAAARQHPSSIERLVLIGPEGPDHTYKLPSAVDAVLERIATRSGEPDLIVRMRAVIAALDAKPARITVTHPQTREAIAVAIGGFDVQWITSRALGDSRTIATLPAAFREMAEGRYERMAQLALVLRSRAGVESAMKQVMDVSSGATTARRARIEAEAGHAVLGNAINFPSMYVGDAWGRPDLGDAFRTPVKLSIPALVLVGDLDARTPIENAREIATHLDGARVVVVENAAHQFDVFGSAAIRTLLGAFLRGERIASDVLTLPPPAFPR